jgi:hypothetical protein
MATKISRRDSMWLCICTALSYIRYLPTPYQLQTSLSTGNMSKCLCGMDGTLGQGKNCRPFKTWSRHWYVEIVGGSRTADFLNARRVANVDTRSNTPAV